MNWFQRGVLALLILVPLSADAKVKRSPYLKRVQADVDGIASDLRDAEQKGASVASEKQAQFQDLLKALWKKERLARVQLEQLKKAAPGSDRWKKLRAEEDATLIRLRKSYQYLVNHYLR